MRYQLVIMRHGESQWNLENRFTGWADIDPVSYTHLTLPT
ncbi:MAG: hypothetical protein EBX60_10135, partial [Betaproteobacteria bacterium]|nr:hypothetical protein [Betaproteobacteria bacterium]